MTISSQLLPDVLVLRGAQLADGSGVQLRPADVMVCDGRIEAVSAPGELCVEHATEIDLTGHVLAPGFIDVHSHDDNAPLLAESDDSKIRQGVTTEIVGNCGFSLAPRPAARSATVEEFSRRIFPPMTWHWNSFAELFEHTDSLGYVTNYCPMVGHGTLRIAAAGLSDAPVSAAEMRVMQRELSAAMEAGAFGISSGLVYAPASYSPTDELVTLVQALEGEGLYTSHIRNESDESLAAVEEALSIGAAAGRTHVSHLKAAGRQNWGNVARALALLDARRQAGQIVHQDVYPYTAASTMLTAALPADMLAGETDEVLDRITTPGARARIARTIEEGAPGWENFIGGAGWDGVMIATTASGQDEGRTLAELAAERGRAPADVVIDLLVRERLESWMVVFSMSEDDLVTALKNPFTMIGSDGMPPGNGGRPHPRRFGTFPRTLGRYCRELGALGVEEAVRRMTSLPAEAFRVPERGLVRPGYVADLVAFDAAVIRDRGGYLDPDARPEGLRLVVQAGHVVVEHGSFLGTRRGTRLSPA